MLQGHITKRTWQSESAAVAEEERIDRGKLNLSLTSEAERGTEDEHARKVENVQENIKEQGHADESYQDMGQATKPMKRVGDTSQVDSSRLQPMSTAMDEDMLLARNMQDWKVLSHAEDVPRARQCDGLQEAKKRQRHLQFLRETNKEKVAVSRGNAQAQAQASSQTDGTLVLYEQREHKTKTIAKSKCESKVLERSTYLLEGEALDDDEEENNEGEAGEGCAGEGKQDFKGGSV